MKLNFKARSWHIWASIILALPILIVGATAVFIAHKKALGTENIAVPGAQFLPGYQATKKQQPLPEVRTVLLTLSGRTLVGMQEGLYELKGQTLEVIPELDGMPIRGLVEASFGLVAATKNGVWLNEGSQWHRVSKGEAWNATLRPDASVAVAIKDEGVIVSRDGSSWVEDKVLSSALAAMPTEMDNKPITLNKLIMDLHTGKAFLGKKAEWIWIDVLGLAMSLLAVTGVYMWWRGEKRKAAALSA